jgi:hypothetical protein
LLSRYPGLLAARYGVAEEELDGVGVMRKAAARTRAKKLSKAAAGTSANVQRKHQR